MEIKRTIASNIYTEVKNVSRVVNDIKLELLYALEDDEE